MQLLIDWRDGAVREHRSHYTAYDGSTLQGQPDQHLPGPVPWQQATILRPLPWLCGRLDSLLLGLSSGFPGKAATMATAAVPGGCHEDHAKGFSARAGRIGIGRRCRHICKGHRQCCAIALGRAGVKNAASNGGTAAKRWGMAIDFDKCQKGCNDCIAACNSAHNIPQIPDPAHEVKWIWEEPYEDVFPYRRTDYTRRIWQEVSCWFSAITASIRLARGFARPRQPGNATTAS